MKIVYVAGPFRGKTRWDVQQNVRRAEELSLEVAKLGAMPLCPHKNTENFDGLLTDEFWIEGTKELLRRCDAIVCGPGYGESVGARGEIAKAFRLGLPVFLHTEMASLGRWVKEQEK